MRLGGRRIADRTIGQCTARCCRQGVSVRLDALFLCAICDFEIVGSRWRKDLRQ